MPFLQCLLDAIKRVFRKTTRFQPVPLKAVDLIQRAGAKNAQAHVVCLGLACGHM
jgi:hypothetical protein